MNEAVKNQELRDKIAQDYEWGFSSDIEQEFAPKGLNVGIRNVHDRTRAKRKQQADAELVGR